MALRDFSFWENVVGSEVTSIKITFSVTFNTTWTHILAPKRPRYGLH